MSLITQAMADSINASVLCWLATSSADGQPNVSPKEVFVLWQDRLLVAQIASPQTVKNVKENPKVCVSFVDILVQKGFQLKGTAELINREDDRFEDRHAALFEVAGPDFPFATLIEIKIESAKAIVAPRYKLFPNTTEEEQIASAKRRYGFSS